MPAKSRPRKWRIRRRDRGTIEAFHIVAAFLGSEDHDLLAKMRNVAAFHYEPKLSIRRLRRLAEKFPGPCFEHLHGK
jgi:hypothetical protein